VSGGRRRFNRGERRRLWHSSGGNCAACGELLYAGWHADHITPWVANGQTEISNGQALCPPCNLKKGAAVSSNPTLEPWDLPLHDWQADNGDRLVEEDHHNWTQQATTAAGKTRFAGYVTHRLLTRDSIEQVLVIVPSDQLRGQWVAKFHEMGIELDPEVIGDAPRPREGSGFRGMATTYQMLVPETAASNFADEVARKPTLVIVDECHHAGDGPDGEGPAFGQAVNRVLAAAEYRLLLTGTAWRTGSTRIAGARYDDDGVIICDGQYPYWKALQDGVVRSVEFYSYDGDVHWLDVRHSESGPEFVSRDEALTDLRTKYDQRKGLRGATTSGEWTHGLLEAAVEHRDNQAIDDPTAAGLVIAASIEDARRCAQSLYAITGEQPLLVHQKSVKYPDKYPATHADIPTEIGHFADGNRKWIVSVAMIREGTDIPRLTTLALLSTINTKLHFRQSVGRVLRRRSPEATLTAAVFLPAIKGLLTYATEMALEVDDPTVVKPWSPPTEGPGEEGGWVPTPIDAFDPRFDAAIVDGRIIRQAAYERAAAYCRAKQIPLTLAAAFADFGTELAAESSARPVDIAEPSAAAQRATLPSVAAQIKTARERRTLLVRRVVMTERSRSGYEWQEVNTLIGKLTAFVDESTLPQLLEANAILERWAVDGIPVPPA
jgi:superfamily II DNA or RNA helicase